MGAISSLDIAPEQQILSAAFLLALLQVVAEIASILPVTALGVLSQDIALARITLKCVLHDSEYRLFQATITDEVSVV